MELVAIYFIIQKIKARTEEYEYNSAPHIKLAVILWLAGEIAGGILGAMLVHNWLFIYLMAVGLSSLGGFFVYYKVMNLPKRNVDYFDLRQTKTYPFLESDPEQTQMFKAETMTQRTEKPAPRQEPGSSEEDFTPFWMTQLKNDQQEKELQSTQRVQKAPSEAQATPNPSLFAQKTPLGFHTPETKPAEPSTPEFKVVDFNSQSFKTQEQPFEPAKEEQVAFNNAQAYPANSPTQVFPAHFERKEEPVAFKDTQAYPANNPTQAYPTYVERKEDENTRVFANKVERKEDTHPFTNSQVFKFPYSELAPLNELFVSEYGLQTVKDRPVSDFDWFPGYKAKYESQEIRGALVILEKALYQNLDNGFIWLLYGVLYKDVYQNYEKALQFCLTGAKRCNTYKSALLTEAAELMLFGMRNIAGAFTFFCHAVKAISENSKAWGQPGATGAISQERAFHYMRVLLTIYNFNDYRLYLERNVRFHTGLDQALIEKVIALCSESASREEVEGVIRRLFPTIIEKMQSLG